MINPFRQSKVTYKISFTTYFDNLENFEDIINDILQETVLGISTHEKSSQTIDSQPDDIWEIEVYLSENPNADYIIEALNKAASLASLIIIDAINIEEIEDQDWVSIYQSSLKPLEVGRFFISSKIHQNLCPTDRNAIFVEASRAFGTGDHATTSGCIEALENLIHLKFDNIIDVGTGTGILSFAAKHLWPDARVVACDIEEVAVDIAQDGARTNNLDIEIYQNLDDRILNDKYKQRKFNLIISNILAGPLTQLAKEMRSFASDSAYIILAGFLNTQQEEVQACFESYGFKINSVLHKDSWVILTMNL